MCLCQFYLIENNDIDDGDLFPPSSLDSLLNICLLFVVWFFFETLALLKASFIVCGTCHHFHHQYHRYCNLLSWFVWWLWILKIIQLEILVCHSSRFFVFDFICWESLSLSPSLFLFFSIHSIHSIQRECDGKQRSLNESHRILSLIPTVL